MARLNICLLLPINCSVYEDIEICTRDKKNSSDMLVIMITIKMSLSFGHSLLAIIHHHSWAYFQGRIFRGVKMAMSL